MRANVTWGIFFQGAGQGFIVGDRAEPYQCYPPIETTFHGGSVSQRLPCYNLFLISDLDPLL